MGANFSKLDNAIASAAYDDQAIKDILYDLIGDNQETFGDVVNDDEFWDSPPTIRTRTTRRRSPNLWETGWGRLLLSDAIKDPDSYEAKIFRKRFRLPYPLFQRFVAECKRDFHAQSY